jgi:hypothetical protein
MIEQTSLFELDPATVDSADTVHRCLVRLGRERARNDWLLCRWLVRADELHLERSHGYASLREYAERVCGLRARALEDRLRVGRAMRELPRLSGALEKGAIVYSSARELCRVATADTEEVWLEQSRGKSCTEVRGLVAGRERGDLPSDPPQPQLGPYRVVLEMDFETYALFNESRKDAIRERGAPVDESELVRWMAHTFLHRKGERDQGKAAFQIALTVGPDKRPRIRAGGQEVVVDDAILEMARCDATFIGPVDIMGVAARATQSIPPRIRRQVFERDGGICAVPGCRNCIGHIHHLEARADGGTHDPDKMCLLCTQHHQAAHYGALLVVGSFTEGFRFLHADGRAYGTLAPELGARRVLAEAFEALKGMGWKEREARQLVDAVRSEVDAASPTPDLEDVVKQALRRAAVPTVREERAVYRRAA